MKSVSSYRKGGQNSPPSFFRNWMAFLSGIAIIAVYITVIGPWIMELPYMKPINKIIKERGIEANLYDYTEVEAFSDADFYMRHAMENDPKDSGYIITVISGVVLFGVIAWIGYKYILNG